ncbi:hypothetical protein [Streptomyces nigrescens]|uniref:hypothetical protein n=1 Tax=Streptomyces nigrescens TaxID=1920 RepID=UPI0036FE3745
MTTTTLAHGEPPEAMPIWARLQLASLGIPFRKVTHFLGSIDGARIGAAVNGQPVYLTRPTV